MISKSYCQTLTEADSLFSAKKYNEALTNYLNLGKTKFDKNDFKGVLITFKIAECYRNLSDTINSKDWYIKSRKQAGKHVRRINDSEKKNILNDLIIMADSYFYIKKYETARIYYLKIYTFFKEIPSLQSWLNWYCCSKIVNNPESDHILDYITKNFTEPEQKIIIANKNCN